MQKFGLLFVLGLLAAAVPGVKADESKTRTLEVKMDYTGSGPVDAKHKIHVALWDTADFMNGGGPPIATEAATEKDGVVTFKNIEKVPVYVTAVYDPTGNYQGDAPPPSGASLGLYKKDGDGPGPIDIAEGKTATVTVHFDDSAKMH